MRLSLFDSVNTLLIIEINWFATITFADFWQKKNAKPNDAMRADDENRSKKVTTSQ